MIGVALALLIYLLPGIAIVGWYSRRAIARHGHNGWRVVVPALLLAVITWPMIFVPPRGGR